MAEFKYVMVNSTFRLSRHSPGAEYKAALKEKHLASQLEQHYPGSEDNQPHRFEAETALKE